MRKRLLPAVTVLVTAIALSGTALADERPTDEYGNVIDWDVNGSGGEDSAGLETLDESTSSEESETYSFEEQVDVFAQMAAAETEAPAETGLLTVRLGGMPSEWSQNNIKLSLYRGNAREDIFLYRQSEWTESTQLPVGHYTVYKIETLDGEESFHSDISTFDITEETAVNLTISYGAQEAAVPDVTIPDSEAKDITSEDIDPDMQVSTDQNTSFYIAAIVASAFVLLGICWIGKGRKGKIRDIDRSSLD